MQGTTINPERSGSAPVDVVTWYVTYALPRISAKCARLITLSRPQVSERPSAITA